MTAKTTSKAAKQPKPAKGTKNPRDATTPVGPIAAKSILDFFGSPLGIAVVDRLKALEINPQSARSSAAGSPAPKPLAGKSFVLTGTLPTLSRDQASGLIREAGGAVGGSVSKKTDFLLAGEDAGSKLEKAKSLGVSILTEAQFLYLLRSKPNAEAE